MIPEETLRKVIEAFQQVECDSDLKGWSLDDKVISPFSQEPDSTRLVIGLLRGQSEHASVVIDPAGVAQLQGGLTVSGLAAEIRRALHGQGILTDDRIRGPGRERIKGCTAPTATGPSVCSTHGTHNACCCRAAAPAAATPSGRYTRFFYSYSAP